MAQSQSRKLFDKAKKIKNNQKLFCNFLVLRSLRANHFIFLETCFLLWNIPIEFIIILPNLLSQLNSEIFHRKISKIATYWKSNFFTFPFWLISINFEKYPKMLLHSINRWRSMAQQYTHSASVSKVRIPPGTQ